MIGKILKNMRLSLNWSQKELGEKIVMADTTISSYERGHTQPDFDTVLKIARTCGYDFCIIDKNKELISLKEMSKEDLYIKTKRH